MLEVLQLENGWQAIKGIKQTDKLNTKLQKQNNTKL